MEIIVIVLVILCILILKQYNTFVRLKNQVKQAKSGIDIYLNQRFDLIPNLVECVKGYTNHEKDVIETVTNMRTNYLNGTKKNIKTAEKLNNSMNKLIAVAENYPELKANEQFLNLQKNLTKIESQLQAARRIYNNEVTKYNIKVTTIPSNIIMISHNYDKSNNEPIDFIKNNIQENDVIVYPGIGTGAIMSAKFPQYKQYFYNAEDWGVEEAYKAFGPAMQTYTTDDFLNDEECQGRIWLVLDFYKVDYFNEKFNNDNYRVLAKKQYFTKYNKEKAQNKETEYNIYLIEKINQ